MTRLHVNFVYGVIKETTLDTAITMRSDQFVGLPIIAAPNTLTLICDPVQRTGAPEVVYITAHSSATDTVTVLRGQEGTAARNYIAGDDFVHTITAAELDAFASTTVSIRTVVNSDAVVSDTDDVIIMNSSAAHSVTLHNGVDAVTKWYSVKNIGTGAVTCLPPSGETIDGASSYGPLAQHQVIDFLPDGTADWKAF